MEKELESCTGVLFKADLTGQGLAIPPFLADGYGWPCPFRRPILPFYISELSPSVSTMYIPLKQYCPL